MQEVSGSIPLGSTNFPLTSGDHPSPQQLAENWWSQAPELCAAQSAG
jgi:hypothetical protein